MLRLACLVLAVALTCAGVLSEGGCPRAASAQEELFVPNQAGNSVTVYSRTASGNAVPLRTISGVATGLHGPFSLAVDTVNNEVVVPNSGSNSVTVYTRTASGNVAPLRTISGAATGLNFPIGLAVDTVNNEVMVANAGGNSITVYSRTASGNAAPLRTISGVATGLAPPFGVAVDTVNNELVVTKSGGAVLVHSRTASGNVAPLRTISGGATGLANPEGLAVDTVNNDLAVANFSGNSVTVYSRTASGNVAPLRTISGGATGLNGPRGLAVDTVNNEMLVASGNSVTVYSRTASGNVAPLRTVSGPATGLSGPGTPAVTTIPQCVAPPSGMVAWWKLDEQTGAAVVTDISGGYGNNNGTPLASSIGPYPPGAHPGPIPGSTFPLLNPPAMVGDSLYFYDQGHGGYITVLANSSLNFGAGDFSIDAWVYPVPLGTGGVRPIVDKLQLASNPVGGIGYRLFILGDQVHFVLLDGVTAVNTQAPITFGQWQHVAVVRRGGAPNTVQVYINGQLVSTSTPVVGSVSNAANLLIGGIVPGASGLPPQFGYSEIAIDELEIFNRALSQSEIQSILNAGSEGKCPPTDGVASLVAAVLPSSRSVQVGTIATAFGTIINAGPDTGTRCGLSPVTQLPAGFAFQTTDPTTNTPTGTPNTPVNIDAGRFQTFVLGFLPTAPIAPTEVQFNFACTNSTPAPITVGLNTLLFSASATPVPDIVAMAATTTNDGILTIPGSNGTGAFSVATVNLGAGALITASADTGGVSVPVTIQLCETNPLTAQCISALGPSVPTQINTGQTPTFSVFVTATGTVPFDPAQHRVFVRFKDGGNVTRGSTSVAAQTH
jgi:DNA-binding beta-propeller fold protein YncE